MILLIYAHPHHSRSLANRVLLDGVRDLPGLSIHSLYDRYPDFSIDVAADQTLLAQAQLVIWQHPLYWYAPPALLKLWFEAVLTRGWAYGNGGNALAGKDCLWVVSTGADAAGYRVGGLHQHPFEAFVPSLKQIAQFCQMRWLEPLVIHDAHSLDRSALHQSAAVYRTRLEAWRQTHG
jgi:glutathione-regulated potassium-efflux system ancillary protein KefF